MSLKKRFEHYREILSNNKISGSLITSKKNFLYLLGFKTEADSYLYVPASDSNINPIIFTNPLEEEIIRDKNPFSEIELLVSFKSIDPITEQLFKNKKYRTIKIENLSTQGKSPFNKDIKEAIISNKLLKDLTKQYLDTKIVEFFDGQNKTEKNNNLQFNGFDIEEVLIYALKNHLVIPSKWDGLPAIIPRYNDIQIITEYFKSISESSLFSTLGLEFDDLTYSNFQNLSKQFRKNSLKIKTTNISSTITELRIIKDIDEIDKLRKAAGIGDKGLEAGIKLIEESYGTITENEVQAEIEYAMKKAGAEKPSFETIVVSGFKSAFPHGHAGDKIIEKGDLVTMDLGAIYEGYCSDMTRTIIVGNEISEKTKKVHNMVMKAYRIGVEAVKVGAHWGDPDIAVRNYYKEIGKLEYYVHSLGHGVGVEIHEAPWINYTRLGKKNLIKAGMVFTIEPGLYIPGTGGARNENTLAIFEDHIEFLNKSPEPKY